MLTVDTQTDRYEAHIVTRRARPGSILAFAGAAVVLLMLLAAGVAQGALNAGAWPMFHKDLAHRGFSSLQAPTTSAIAWSAMLSDTVEFSSPVISAYPTIYIGDQGKELWAFDLYGNQRWHYHTLGNLRYSSAAVSDLGRVYIGAADGTMYAFRENGTIAWTNHAGGAIKTSAAIGPDESIYVGSDDRKLWAFNGNGTLKWTFTTNDTVRSSPAIGADGTIYFGSNDGGIYAVYPNGTLRWRGATGGPIRDCSPALDNAGNIIIGSSDMGLYSIQPTGALNWVIFTGHALRSSPAISPSGRIYLGAGTMIKCFHASDGHQSWEFETGGRVLSTPAVTNNGLNDVVLCGSDSGFLYALNGLDGSLIWSAFIGSPVRSSPAIGPNGFAYVGSFAGRIYAIGQINPADAPGLANGALRLALGPNPLRAGQDLRIDLAASGGGASRGTFSILDASGRVIREIDMTTGSTSRWDGRDAMGQSIPSGVYFYRFDSRAGARASGRIVRVN